MNHNRLVVLIIVLSAWAAPAIGQPAADEPSEIPQRQNDTAPNNLTLDANALVDQGPPADATNAAASAKAAFDKKFDEYKEAIRQIETLNIEFQSADDAQRKKINEQLTGQVAHAQSLVNAMVEAATEAYRFAPNADPKVTDLLIAVARYDAIGRPIGPGQSAPQNPGDAYHPIDGGDRFEKALPIIKLLIDGGAEHMDLYVWGFLCAFATNDYELAAQYLEKAKETNAFESIAASAAKSANEDPQAGLMQQMMHLISTFADSLDEYRGLWAKEAELRAAEAKADDLPRVKLTTTKGEITIELFENEAPQSVANFLTLVKQGFYNGSPFHRVLPKFMAQGGAKDDDGQGGPGYSIRCECYRPDHRRHFRGTLSMAHAGRDTGSSQFFLTFVPTPHLNTNPRGGHTAFGRVIDGMDVLADLQRRSPQQQPNPPEADRILKAEVLRDRGHEYKFEKRPER